GPRRRRGHGDRLAYGVPQLPYADPHRRDDVDVRVYDGAPRGGGGRPHRRGARHRTDGGAAGSRRHGAAGRRRARPRVRPRVVRLPRRRPPGPARRQLRREARRDPGRDRLDGRRQVDAGGPDPAPVRRDRGQREARRRRRPRLRPRGAVGPHRPGAAEGLPVLRDRGLEPALRSARRDRGGDVARPRGGPGARLRRGDARGPRGADRPGRHERLRGPAPAPRDRPRAHQAAVRLRLRRRVLRPRRRHRRQAAGGPGAAAQGRDHRDRGPAREHGEGRRPDPRPRGRPGRRPRPPRGPAADVGDLPRDRRVAAPGGGGLMARRGPGAAGPAGGPQGAAPGGPGGQRILKQTERARVGGGPFGGAMVGGKAEAFGPSARRLVGQLRPHRLLVFLALAMGVAAVALSAVGPRVLGRATDLIFSGVIGAQMPAGITREQAVEGARAAGNARVAEMLAALDFVPGQGVDFEALARVLLLAVAIYVGSALLSFAQGLALNEAVQRTVFRLRSEGEAKLHRLPLSYFDAQPRG